MSDDREKKARLAYSPRDERANRQYATVRLGFDCAYFDNEWSADSRELRTGPMHAATRDEALRDALVFTLRLLADEIEAGGTIRRRTGEPVVEWSGPEREQKP